jgi:hypothetical protein
MLQILLLASPAAGDGSAYPQPPDSKIEMVRGQPIALESLKVGASVDEVRFEVDGTPFQTDSFPPFGDFISTKGRFDRLGLAPEVVHTLSARAIEFDESHVIAEYPLVVHPLPVIDPVKVVPLIVQKQTKLVGFQLSGIQRGYRVMAWGRGFIPHYRYSFLLRRAGHGPSARTYRIPGGLEWRRGVHPKLTISVAAAKGETEFGFSPRGRVLTEILKTGRSGDTRFRETDRGERCSYSLSYAGLPPRRVSCVYLF